MSEEMENLRRNSPQDQPDFMVNIKADPDLAREHWRRLNVDLDEAKAIAEQQILQEKQ